MKTSKQQIVVSKRELLVATPSVVHVAASRRNSAGIMELEGQQRRRAQRRRDRQQERAAGLYREAD